IDHGSGSCDCLNLAGIVWSLEIHDDPDKDGLATDWEVQGYRALNSSHTMLTDLPNMSANPSIPDVYIDIARMRESLNDAVGSPHEHKAKRAAIDMVGEALQRGGVAAHFDLGPEAEYYAN